MSITDLNEKIIIKKIFLLSDYLLLMMNNFAKKFSY